MRTIYQQRGGRDFYRTKKVKGHATEDQCQGDPDRLEEKYRNDAADAGAVRQAQPSAAMKKVETVWKHKRRRARDIMRMMTEILQMRYDKIKARGDGKDGWTVLDDQSGRMKN